MIVIIRFNIHLYLKGTVFLYLVTEAASIFPTYIYVQANVTKPVLKNKISYNSHPLQIMAMFRY